MRLDVLERDPFGTRHTGNRRDLIQDQVFRFRGRQPHLPATEPGQSGKPGCAPIATLCFLAS